MSNFIVCRIAPSDLCAMCYDPLNNGSSSAVYHEGEDGKKHPYHKKCLRDWLIKIYDAKKTPECPSCKTVVNVRSLYSWAEWNGRWIKNAMHHGLVGTVIPLASSSAAMMGVRTFTKNRLFGKLHGAIGGVSGGVGALVVEELLDGDFRAAGLIAGIATGIVLAIGDSVDSYGPSFECVRLTVRGSAIGALAGTVVLLGERKIAEYMQWPASDRKVFFVSQVMPLIALCNLSFSADEGLFHPEQLLPSVYVASAIGGLAAAVFRAITSDLR